MSAVYGTSHLKRHRSTKSEMEQRADALFAIVERIKPATVRGVFYQATSPGIVEKTEAGYTAVQRMLVQLRRSGRMPYGWLTDGTRWQRKPRTHGSPSEALQATAQLYRKRLWDDLDEYAEIWIEKDALAGVVYPITAHFDAPLMVARGYASLSFLHSAAEYINEIASEGISTHIYHFGDFDPSGVDAAYKIRDTLREVAPDAEIHFERVAVLDEQIAALKLPTRPTKKTDSRARNFGEESVELDAIHPDLLRALVYDRLERHLPKHKLDALKVAEESERTLIKSWADRLAAASP